MKKLTQEYVINKMQELEPNYDFSKFIYVNNSYKSFIICSNNHEYECSYSKFVNSGKRCPHCYNNIRSKEKLNSSDYVITRMKELEPQYDFSKFIYINNKTKSIVICNKGHEYEVNWSNFNSGKRCPKCSNKQSKPETEIINFIKTFYNGTIEQSNRNIIKNHMTNRYLELDIYLPELKLAIEFNGIYWHSDKIAISKGWSSSVEFINYKTSKCKEKEIDLIHIFEEDWIKDKQQILNNIKRIINGI